MPPPHPTPPPPKKNAKLFLTTVKLLYQRQALFLCYIAAKNTQYIYLRFSFYLL